MGATRYCLFAADPTLRAAAEKPGGKASPQTPVQYLWRKDVPLIARAMVLADKTLWIAGPPGQPDLGDVKEAAEALEGKKGGLLWGVWAADGARLAQYTLRAPPVFDGMAAANGRLHPSLLDGRVVCLGKR